MEEDGLDVAGETVSGSDREQLLADPVEVGIGLLQFDTEDRTLFPGTPTPISAVRNTSLWVLKIASHGMVKRVSSAVTTRCALRPQNQMRPCSSR